MHSTYGFYSMYSVVGTYIFYKFCVKLCEEVFSFHKSCTSGFMHRFAVKAPRCKSYYLLPQFLFPCYILGKVSLVLSQSWSILLPPFYSNYKVYIKEESNRNLGYSGISTLSLFDFHFQSLFFLSLLLVSLFPGFLFAIVSWKSNRDLHGDTILYKYV